AQKADVLLLAGNVARIRNPRADGLAGRYRVGFDGERLRDADAARRCGPAAGRQCASPDLGVVRVLHRFQRTVVEWPGLGPAFARLFAEPEQVVRRAREIAHLSIDLHRLEQPGASPVLEL